MTRLFLLAALGFTGCSRQPEPEQPNAVVAPAVSPPAPAPTFTPVSVAVAPTPQPQPQPKPQPKAEPVAVAPKARPQPPAPPTVFEYPADLGGKAVAKAVAPPAPTLRPAESFGTAPRPRTPPARLLDPDPVTKPDATLPPILPPKPTEVKPVAPPELVPLDLGVRADAVPARPTFPVAAGIAERARDVAVPPAMPALGRPLAERVPLDDPTTEVGHAAVISPVVKVPLFPAGFLKVTVPDPFELGEQVRPQVPPTAEPGLAPVVVDPRRVK